jgi:hypothetical protein
LISIPLLEALHLFAYATLMQDIPLHIDDFTVEDEQKWLDHRLKLETWSKTVPSTPEAFKQAEKWFKWKEHYEHHLAKWQTPYLSIPLSYLIRENTVLESMCFIEDDDFHSFSVIKEIVDHRMNGHAVAINDGYLKPNAGQRRCRQTTKGWELLGSWLDSISP